MSKIRISKLDRKRFSAFVGASRRPAAAYVSRELGWYANGDESLIGVLLLDTIDFDYAAVVLARDEGGRFRAFDQECSFPTRKGARTWLCDTLRRYTEQGVKVVPQGVRPGGVDLFTPVVPPKKLHPYFVTLTSDSAFVPARSIISEMMPHYVDVDGNFIEQFQSTGFDARLWELYIYAYLVEEGLFLDRSQSRPDFLVEKFGQRAAIEAVIVGRKRDNPPRCGKTPPLGRTPEQVLKSMMHSMPIKFGSPLYSKLQKRYWDLPHVKDSCYRRSGTGPTAADKMRPGR